MSAVGEPLHVAVHVALPSVLSGKLPQYPDPSIRTTQARNS